MALDYYCNCRESSEKYNVDMPNDVLFHIFMRLSVKNLGQMRCVCKSWNYLISSPLFIAHHHRYSTTQKSYLVLRSSIADPNPKTGRILMERNEDIFSYAFYHPNIDQRRRPFILRILCETLSFDSLPFRTRRRNPRVFTWSSVFQLYQHYDHLILIDAIHGVVCLASSLQRPTILWNPTISKYVEIPRSPFEIDDGYTHSFGFGFNSREDDFRLIRLWMPFDCLPGPGASTPLVYEVFSAQKGIWRKKKIVGSEIRPGKFISEIGFFMNGTIHWLLSTPNGQNRNQFARLLMFDCEREEFKTMDLPQIFRGWGPSLNLKVEFFKCRGMLSFLECFAMYGLWVMEEYGVASSLKNMSYHKAYKDSGGMVMEESMFLMDAKRQAVSYAKKRHDNDEKVYYEIDGKTCQQYIVI